MRELTSFDAVFDDTPEIRDDARLNCVFLRNQRSHLTRCFPNGEGNPQDFASCLIQLRCGKTEKTSIWERHIDKNGIEIA